MECDLLSNKHETSYTRTYQYSDRISSRRKALFPTLSDDNSDLGPMSPLSDTNSTPPEYISDKICENDGVHNFKEYFTAFRNNINNYVIINKDNKEDDIIETPNHKCVASSSPLTLEINSPSVLVNKTDVSDFVESPTSNLKTPHDTSTSTVKIPKLIRKHNGDSLHDIETGKHNFSPTNSPNKVAKLDSSFCKMSKIRTALFPEISLPASNFYPKFNDKTVEKPPKQFNSNEKKAKLRAPPTYLCSRKSTRNRFGQINAGVHHKIRKPKQKIPAKITLKKATMNVVESAHLIDYIKDMNNLTQVKPKLIKMINNDKNPSKTSNKPAEIENNANIPDEKCTKDTNKKFFKSGSNAKIAIDTSDFVNDTEPDLIVPSIDTIFDTLDTEDEDLALTKYSSIEPNQIVLKASKRISDSDNSILFHYPHDQSKFKTCKERKRKLEDKENESAEVLLSPTSQMCDMTSGLAINSPKRAKLNITNIIDKPQETNVNIFNKLSCTSEMERKKLFPIFYSSHNAQIKDSSKTNTKPTAVKKWKHLPEGQMLLDAGQKNFGFTHCLECDIIYHVGDPNEERMHENYHNAKHILSFKGWKNENVVGNLLDARIIKISPGDSKLWWKKIKELVEVVNRDLGYFEMELNIENSVVFLYIKNRTIAGCLIAEPKTEAYKILSSFEDIDVCSRETYPIKCGISRIWVSQNNRRNGIASALMDCVRSNFSYGYILKREEMALSSPSELGKLFARKYFQTDKFLIYTS